MCRYLCSEPVENWGDCHQHFAFISSKPFNFCKYVSHWMHVIFLIKYKKYNIGTHRLNIISANSQ